METIIGQAKNWIYPNIGKTKLKDFTATDADTFFAGVAKSLGKRSLVMIKSTLRRSIRRAQVHGLTGRNVIELIDLPAGHPSLLTKSVQWRERELIARISGRLGHWRSILIWTFCLVSTERRSR